MKIRRLLAGALLSTVLTLSLAACGSPAAEPAAEAAASTAEMSEAAADSVAEMTETAAESEAKTAESEAKTDEAKTEESAPEDDMSYVVENIEDIVIPELTDTRDTEEKENTITTLNGDEVTYNMNTRKIVCISGSQDVVAFGIPLLAYEGTTDITGYESYYEGASALLDSTPFSAEEIMSYEPELILVNQKMSTANIATLTKIAPVIPLYTDSTDFETRLSYIGEIFGLEDSADELIKYARTLQESMVAKIGELGLQDKTLTMFTYMGNISIPPERGWFMNTILYEYLGIPRLDNVTEFMQDESGVAYEAISSEVLKQYEGDMVIYAGFGEDTISTYVSENVGWQSLDAVKENRVGIIDITPYAQKGVILLEDQYMQIYEALKVAGGVHG